ncbi:MAG: PEP-CTERM system TPR-repeat protein PrsT, partial [Gammaproteobacteria bacterium]|nr:PEP-CTERM system TPR-repeat protein PrsT [Gammaproteobacteria bacterium]
MSKKIKTLSLAISLACVLSPNAFADTKEAASYYEKALTDYNNKNYKSAELQLKNAIQQDSRYLAAYILLARTYLVNGNGAGAEKEIARAIRQGADKQLTLPILADALIIQNKYAEVLEKIPASGLESKLQSTLLLSRGEAYLETRDYENAFSSYQQAQILQPTTQGPYLGLASIYIAERNYKKAEEQIARALDINQVSAAAWQLKASIQHAEGNISKAMEYYNKSLKADPVLLASLLGRASLYFDTDQLDKALKDLDILTEKYPLEPRVSYLKYSVLSAKGETEKAKEILANTYAYLEKIPFENIKVHASMLLLAGVVSYEIKQYEKAWTYLKEYNRRFPGEVYAEKLLGSVLLTKNEYREAAHLLENVYKRQPNDYQVLTLLGSAYMQMRLYGKANEIFEQAISLGGRAAPARMQKAFNELKFGKEDAALNELKKLFALSNDPRSGLMLTTMFMKKRDYRNAAKTAQAILNKDPDHIIARNFLGVSQIELGTLSEARKNFKLILSQQSDFFPANMNLVKLDMIEGKLDLAEERLLVLLDKKRNLSTVMLALSKLEQQRNNAGEALRWAEKAYDADDKNVSAIVQLTRLQLKAGNVEKALRVAQ